jgi:hypothetical protein
VSPSRARVKILCHYRPWCHGQRQPLRSFGPGRARARVPTRSVAGSVGTSRFPLVSSHYLLDISIDRKWRAVDLGQSSSRLVEGEGAHSLVVAEADVNNCDLELPTE